MSASIYQKKNKSALLIVSATEWRIFIVSVSQFLCLIQLICVSINVTECSVYIIITWQRRYDIALLNCKADI